MYHDSHILRKEETIFFKLMSSVFALTGETFIVLPLTVLGDKSNTAVHDDWHAILCQLLVTKCIAVRAGGQRDG